MYRYDEFDHAFVRERVAEFKDQVERRLAGALSEDEFRPLRLRNGLYLQLHAYMLRIAIPYGVLSPKQLRQLAMIGRKWDRGYGHFTTRQNLQFNWVKLVDIPEVLAALAEVEMHCIQTSGNSYATLPPIRLPARPMMSSRTRVPGARSCANGRPTIPNSAGCRASSRSPSRARPKIARPSPSTISA